MYNQIDSYFHPIAREASPVMLPAQAMQRLVPAVNGENSGEVCKIDVEILKIGNNGGKMKRIAGQGTEVYCLRRSR